MFWIALAAQFSIPLMIGAPSGDIRTVFSNDDFPAYLLRGPAVSRTVYTRTTVRPDGAIQSCTVDVSSGDRALDSYTCGLILKRAKLRPATWTDGSAAFGVIRYPINWWVGDYPRSDAASVKAINPDLDLSVNSLPKGAPAVIGVELQVAVDSDGRISACAEQPPLPWSKHRRRFPELAQLACQQATTALKLRPPVDSSGNQARSVQTVLVHVQASGDTK
jgi:hypothetical protein